MKKQSESKFLKSIKKTGRILFSFTLIPYGIATYNELRTVSWMGYWTTIKVTAFVLLFTVLTAVVVYGLDQVVTKLFDLIIKKA